MKKCRCGETEPSQFTEKAQYCRACVKKKNQKHYSENKEYHLEKTRRWIAENEDRQRENLKRWREEHPEYSKQYQREHAWPGRNWDIECIPIDNQTMKELKWDREHGGARDWTIKCIPIDSKTMYELKGDIMRASMKEWRKQNPGYHREHRYNNPDMYKQYGKNRAEHIRRAPKTMPTGWWEILLDYYGYQCCRCGSVEKLTHDHVIPLSWFCSTHSLQNSQVLCQKCNSEKHNSTRADYRDGNIITLEIESQIISKRMKPSEIPSTEI